VTSDHLPGWGDPAPSPVETGDLDGILGSINPQELVAVIAADPEALAALAAAITGETPPDTLCVFATAAEFVQEYLTRVFRKHLSSKTVKWCEQWWEHVEARSAIEALWDRWEVDRRGAGGTAHWFQYYGWPFMDRLTHPDTSPFDGCLHTVLDAQGNVTQKAIHHPEKQRRLPIALAPEDLFMPVPTKANPHPEQ
jgi:hypothetical protein